MRLIFILIAIMSIALIENSFAFDWNKCRKGVIPHSSWLFSAGLIVSSTSYISSTGECSMIGSITHNKKVFVAQNYIELMEDAAKGQGDYLEQYALMNNCNVLKYSNQIHQNYSHIFMTDDPESIYLGLEKHSCLERI